MNTVILKQIETWWSFDRLVESHHSAFVDDSGRLNLIFRGSPTKTIITIDGQYSMVYTKNLNLKFKVHHFCDVEIKEV
jgi:hypothetical protein